MDITLRRLLGVASGDSAAAEKAVDVKRVVANLRKQRYGMVQNPSQYLFCHQVIHIALPLRSSMHWGLPKACLFAFQFAGKF